MKRPAFGVWFKSSRSEGAKACVEIRHDRDLTQIRDSQDNGIGPVLSFAPEVWEGFLVSRIWER
ncbi:DUF397 domain-containing protein [Nocardia sp. NPDC051030]|uniref:DUF397 domain-containing protein n=1 Tax=Nocardia sp. NPDC051030 TaxID=3155162 RepID=UPI0034473762